MTATSKNSTPGENKFEEYIRSCTIIPWKTIVVGIDNTYVSAIVFERALKLAASSCSKLYVLHVIPTSLPYSSKSEIAIEEGMYEFMLKEAEDMFNSIKKRFAEMKIDGETVLLEGDPAEELIRFIKEKNIELVILGSKEKMHTPVYLGSVSKKVSEQATCSVLIERIT